jgi:hypothetical protein
MEHRMGDGSLMVIVRDKRTATWYEQFRKEPGARSIWTLAELEVVMTGPTLTQVRGIKAAIPGTTMVPVTPQGSSGFEEMENDIDISKRRQQKGLGMSAGRDLWDEVVRRVLAVTKNAWRVI